MEMKWPIPDINGISYTSTMSIYSNGVLIKELSPGRGLTLARDAKTNECWIVAEDPPAGEYTILIETGLNEILVYDSGVIEGSIVIPDELPIHTWSKFLRGPEDTLATVKKATDRYLTCKGCPFFENNVCLACGCPLPLKTKMENETCPKDKW